MNNLMKAGILSLLIFALFLGACSGLTKSDKPALKTWWLEPYVGVTRETNAEEIPLVSVSVTVVPGLDNNRILTLTDDAELNRYTAARWAENLPELVTSLVGRTLQLSGRFDVISERGRAGSEDCSLDLEVSEFFTVLEAPSRTTGVRVGISGRYQCEPDSPVPVQLSSSVPVHGEKISEIIAAFQEAVDDVMEELLEQL